MTTPGKRGFGTGVVVAIAAGAFLAGCVGGCTFGVATSSDSHDSGASAPTTGTRVPLTAPAGPDDAFLELVRTVPVGEFDAKALAASSCLAFKQNPGTTMDAASNQLASQRSWTYSQGKQFLYAATSTYCPEFRDGS